jgi:hypothetical protein
MRLEIASMPNNHKRGRSKPSTARLNEEIAATAWRLQELFEARYGLDYVERVWINGFYGGADYSDGSCGGLIRYRKGSGPC